MFRFFLIFRASILSALLLLVLPLKSRAQTQPIALTGKWAGILGPINLIVTFSNPTIVPHTAILDIPAQKVKGLPLILKETTDSVYLRLPQVGVFFAGHRSTNGQKIVGEWHQGGQLVPLTLNPIDTELIRPQTPRPPFSYQTETVTFKNTQAGVLLAGTLTVPMGAGPFPAVALLTGSGSQDRNSSIYGHQLFWVLADYLTRHGVAVLRFDDRGVGQSGGSQDNITSADYATDALAALKWLRAQSKIIPSQAGLLGHSEGGTAAIAAAGQPNGPNFLVLMATPGLAGDDLIVQQSLAAARLQTSDPGQLANVEKMQRAVTQIIQKTPDNNQARAQLLALFDPNNMATPQAMSQLEPQITTLTSLSYRHLLADRPGQSLLKVHCPVLAINGAKDIQVAAGPNLAAISKGLTTANNHHITTIELPGLNHLFQTALTGSVAEYGTIEETLAPAALQIIGDWLIVTTKLQHK